MDTLLIGERKEEKSPAPGGIRTHNLKSLIPQADALPLCYSNNRKITNLFRQS